MENNVFTTSIQCGALGCLISAFQSFNTMGCAAIENPPHPRPLSPVGRGGKRLAQCHLWRWGTFGIDPLDDFGPAVAFFVVLQVAVDGTHWLPPIFHVKREDRVE